jgi:formylmethanofuran dehydrogenase subunit A
MSLLKIASGTVFDPANGVDGVVSDIWIDEERIVPRPPHAEREPFRTLNAAGLVVMPGGVDMHAHIAGPKVNLARRLRPEDQRNAPKRLFANLGRSGTLASVPTNFVTGCLYAGMGYTTVMDPAIPPLGARQCHHELSETPLIDKGFLILLANNDYVLRQLTARELDKLRGYCGWLLNATRGYGIKAVNPGGVEAWKQGKPIAGLDSAVGTFDVTPRQIVVALAQTAVDLGLPHPLHIHCNNLGIPGNWTTTLETMKALEGRPAHLTHIQFHSYGGEAGNVANMNSQAQKLADYVNQHPELTVDVGQVLFGETTCMTADGPLGHYLAQVTGRKWVNVNIEAESGCGIVPITYHDKKFVHALQWAIGLEWFLLVNDPWRLALTTDHPNGASFLAYPQIIALLMDRQHRRDVLKSVHPRVGKCSILQELDREYSLGEIAIITRAAPARILGLKNKGHLGPGADADITIYSPGQDRRAMFEAPRYVIKAGRIVVDDGELRALPKGSFMSVQPPFDADVVPEIRRWFEKTYTMRFANYPLETGREEAS